MDDRFVAIDWGSSNFRAYRVTSTGRVLERLATGEGVANLTREGMAKAVAVVAARWPSETDALFCCGMIGSSVGWAEVPYLKCPISPEQIALQMTPMEIQGQTILVSPGLTCRSEDGSPDVIRGEEVLCLGSLRGNDLFSQGRGLLCLPGTHTKWVAIEDGSIHAFSTSLVGELYGALSTSNVFRNHLQGTASVSEAFLRGVDYGASGGGLTRLLFTVRSRSVLGELPHDDAPSYASGVLIGNDIRDATHVYRRVFETAPLCLVGEPELCELYQAALRHLGKSTTVTPAESACIRGFSFIRDVTRDTGR